MKIVHISYSDKSGGAGIAAYRHNEAMNKAGTDSDLLVVVKSSKNHTVHLLGGNKLWLQLKNKIFNTFHSLFIKRFKPFASFSYAMYGHRIAEHPLVQQADVIYLHWINASTLNIKGIESLLKTGKPVFWYMHDMYPLTGGCHHSFGCTKYETECRDCEMLQHSKWIDLANRQFDKKIKHWRKYTNLKIVTPSKWLGDCVQKSAIFKEHEIFVCPNVLDTDKYKPISKTFAKELLGLDTNKKTILFGAVNVNSPYKGWGYLKECLQILDKNKYECLVFGSTNKEDFDDLNIDFHFTGYLSDDYSMIIVYNASDVLVSSSLADNYPNVIVEAMSCGVPCVGFNVGGIPDLIKHENTGYLANYKDGTDLAAGVVWILEETSRYSQLSSNARNFITQVSDLGFKRSGHRLSGRSGACRFQSPAR